MNDKKDDKEPSLELNNLSQDKGEKKEQKYNKELYIVLGAMVFLIIVFFASYFIFNSLNIFEYEGLTFTKEKFGEIPVYHYYYFYDFDGKKYQYNLYLRNDPRENTVPIIGAAIQEEIEFPIGNVVYISLDPNESIVGCEYSSVGLSNLASFFVNNQLKVKSASTIKEVAEENNIEYATCKTHPADNVIIIKSGNETQVIREKDSCTIIQIADCQVLEAMEKFQLEALLDSRERGFSPL